MLYLYLTEEQRLRIHFDKSSDFKFKGSRHLFKHVVFNLIKNTISHAGSNAKIYIWVEKNKLHYKDDGNGIKKMSCQRFLMQIFLMEGLV